MKYLWYYVSPRQYHDLDRRLLDRLISEGARVDCIATAPLQPELEGRVGEVVTLDRNSLCRVQDWESDPGAVQEADEAILALERDLGVSLRRCLIGDRHLNRVFTSKSIVYLSSSRIEWASQDRENPIRYIRRAFRAIRDVFDRSSPDVVYVLSGDTTARLLGYLAMHRGIPVVNITYNQIFFDRVHVSRNLFGINDQAFDRYFERLATGTPRLSEYLDKLRRLEFVQSYIKGHRKHLSDLRAERKRDHPLANFGRALRVKTAHGVRKWLLRAPRPDTDRILAETSVWNSLQTSFSRLGRQRRIARDERLCYTQDVERYFGSPYVYFPLHMEPEEVIYGWAPAWSNTLAVIESLVQAVPLGTSILVKESVANLGRRPAAFYEALNRWPRVVVVDPRVESFDIIQHATLLIVIVGTSGWEGLCLGKPVIHLGPAWYGPLGLAHTVQDMSFFDRTIIEAMSNPYRIPREEHERRIALFIEASDETSVPFDVPDGLDRIHALFHRAVEAGPDRNSLLQDLHRRAESLEADRHAVASRVPD